MSFLRVDDSHLAVPGKMDMDEMAFLAALAAQVPQGGRIVEVGPFYGRSTRAIGGLTDTRKSTPEFRRLMKVLSGILPVI